MIADAGSADEEADRGARTRALLGQISLLIGFPVSAFTAATQRRIMCQGGTVPDEAERAELLSAFDRIDSREHRHILIAVARAYARPAV